MLEHGEDFQEDLNDIQFNLVGIDIDE